MTGSRGTPAIDRVGLFLLGALENTDLRPSDLAAAVELEMSTVSRRLARLESARLIRRRADAEDGRVQRISLTSDGREVLDQARAARTAVLDVPSATGTSRTASDFCICSTGCPRTSTAEPPLLTTPSTDSRYGPVQKEHRMSASGTVAAPVQEPSNGELTHARSWSSCPG